MSENFTVVFDGVAKFKESIKSLQQTQLLVGIPSEKDERNDDDPDIKLPISNAALGYIEEFGSPDQNIPARPSLIPGVEKVKDKLADEFKYSAIECFNDPGAIEKHQNRAGIIAVSSVKATLTEGEGFEPLKDSTIAARKRAGFKGEKPLIRSGQFRNSFTYVIRKIRDN